MKFIRLAEYMIEKNGEGVLGFITNHGYLDNPTFLDMRHHLRQTFDRIHVLDLHGNAKKKEVCPDGSPDKNVFDIQQGVAIIVAVKHRDEAKAKHPAIVFHGDLWGSREAKNQALWEGTPNVLASEDVSPEAAPWRFKPTDKELEVAYSKGFSVADLFSPNGRPAPGIVTTQDEFAISWSAAEAAEKVEFLLHTANEAEARQRFRLCSQSQWNYASAKAALADEEWRKEIEPIDYRPFDTRFTVYNSNVAVHLRDRAMRHMREGPNIGLCFNRTVEQVRPFTDIFVFDSIIQHHSLSLKEVNSLAPLYLYPEREKADDEKGQGDMEARMGHAARINFESRLYKEIRGAAGLVGTAGAPKGTASFRLATGDARPDEVKVFDYIYGALHCPAYRETFAEFLKAGFPRVPFPPSPETFRKVSEQGEALRRLHLMEDAAIGSTPYPFHGEGNSVVDKPRFEDGKVWINASQHFEDVPAIAWDFHIGGYQPVQKWLTDRKGRALGWDDIRHYQKIIKILAETDRIMKEIKLPLV